jgi:hypothetical protein
MKAMDAISTVREQAERLLADVGKSACKSEAFFGAVAVVDRAYYQGMIDALNTVKEMAS